MTNGNIERLLVEIKESLERELGSVRERLTAIESSLARQSGLIAAGTRALAKTEEWSGSSDVRMAALEERVRRLEQQRGGT